MMKKIKKMTVWVLAGSLIAVLTLFFVLRPRGSSFLMKPRLGPVVESIYGLGTVTADQIFHVRGGLTLSIKKLFVKEGDAIRKGDPLVQLDESVIRSPIDGTVTEVAFKEGEVVPSQIPVVTVVNLQKLYLEVSLEQQSVLRIKPNQTSLISFESLRNIKSTGVVRSIFPKSNQFIVRIELQDWPVGVLPGMTADVAILVGEKKDALLIPLKSVSSGRVIRVKDGKRDKVPVQLGVVDGEWAEVTSNNLDLNDEILVKSQ
jgi:multidrug efflux pump subunit AcrA (membrane-fusion protein)